MKVGELIQRFRLQADDAEGREFWTDEELVGYLNDAVQEACERAKLIQDRMILSVTPGQPACELHPSVFAVERVTLTGRPLHNTSTEELDCSHPGWETRTGQPQCFVFEQANAAPAAQLRLVPMPHQAMQLVATVYRGALVPLSLANLNAEPEINARLHPHLLHWMHHSAFQKLDAEVFDAGRSASSLVLFEQAFGQRPDANVQRKQRERRAHVVRFRW